MSLSRVLIWRAFRGGGGLGSGQGHRGLAPPLVSSAGAPPPPLRRQAALTKRRGSVPGRGSQELGIGSGAVGGAWLCLEALLGSLGILESFDLVAEPQRGLSATQSRPQKVRRAFGFSIELEDALSALFYSFPRNVSRILRTLAGRASNEVTDER